MRWSNFFEGFDSLWDGENDGAEWDERRELVRADRATQTFRSVVASMGRDTPLDTSVAGMGGAIHLRRLGANWVDGVQCVSQNRVVIPLANLATVATGSRCDCSVIPISVLNYVTLAAVFRELERQQMSVSAIHGDGGTNGTLAAVWKDAVTLRTGATTTTIHTNALKALVVQRA
jgi:hypothetical protein